MQGERHRRTVIPTWTKVNASHTPWVAKASSGTGQWLRWRCWPRGKLPTKPGPGDASWGSSGLGPRAAGGHRPRRMHLESLKHTLRFLPAGTDPYLLNTAREPRGPVKAARECPLLQGCADSPQHVTPEQWARVHRYPGRYKHRKRRNHVISCAESLSRVFLWPPRTAASPSSSVRGILQARILEWFAIPLSRRSSPHWDRTWVSCISCNDRALSEPRDRTHVSCIAGRFFTCWAVGEARSKSPQSASPWVFSALPSGRWEENTKFSYLTENPPKL